MIARLFQVSTFLAAALMLQSCGNLPPPLAASDATENDVYHLGAGEKLRITVFSEPTLTNDYSITSEGTISFPLIGTINAKGATIEQVSESIRSRLADGYLKDPRIGVEVLTYRPYYILGEVNRPGQYPYTNGMTIEQAVAAAGGYTYRANKNVVIIRRNGVDGEKSVNLRTRSIPVLAGDTIRVAERYF
jgi:polysaccharide export outer membrane protein